MNKPFLVLGLFLVVRCSTQPAPIEYGRDECSFCSMTIVDTRHGAELVTNKGKIYKFDSFECLLGFQKQHDHVSYSHVLTNHFETPEEFINAHLAYYLISKNLRSPMNANITAFESEKEVKKIQIQKQGTIYTFKEIKPFGLSVTDH